MNKALIKLSYKQVIEITSKSDFECDVFNDTYEEFLMQAQVYNPGNNLKTFKELTANNPKANSLHYKVGFAMGLYLKDLNKQIPGLYDSTGKEIITFESHRFEITESDVTNKAAHKVAVHYTSGTLTLYGCIGEYMLLAIGDKLSEYSDEPAETFLMKIQPGLSVCTYQEQRGDDGLMVQINSSYIFQFIPMLHQSLQTAFYC